MPVKPSQIDPVPGMSAGQALLPMHAHDEFTQ
jgi:hypothetical protein